MSVRAEIEAILASPDISDWLKSALTSALKRDSNDSVRDAELLFHVLERHATETLEAAIATSNLRPDLAQNSIDGLDLSSQRITALAPEAHPCVVYAVAGPVKSPGNANAFRLNPNGAENVGSLNPGIEALKKLEARQVAMLHLSELELLREFMDHGRKQGVLVDFDTDSDVQGWAELDSHRRLEVLALANSYVRLQFVCGYCGGEGYHAVPRTPGVDCEPCKGTGRAGSVKETYYDHHT